MYPEGYPDEAELIKFDKTGKQGRVVGRADDGLAVFVDKYRNVNVELGESWYCRLVRPRDSLGNYYWAWPIEKVRPISRSDQSFENVTDEKFNGDVFVAVGNDTIRSIMLSPGRYEAYRSLNGMWLQLKPSDGGRIECIDNSVVLKGLDSFVSRSLPATLEYICSGDSFLIKLEG